MSDELDEVEEPEDEYRADENADEPWERPVDRFRRTATGSVVAAGLLGLRNALEGPQKDEVVIVSEAPAAPPRGNIDLTLDPEHPERSVAIVYRKPDRREG